MNSTVTKIIIVYGGSKMKYFYKYTRLEFVESALINGVIRNAIILYENIEQIYV